MFRCTWLHAPREPALASRLYRRTYGRTYGRRPCEADQPRTLPETLSLTEAPSMTASPVVETLLGNAGDSAAASAAAHIGRAA